ncbi:MAG: phytanoyl-CoA dioxygenase family protein [bacterium]
MSGIPKDLIEPWLDGHDFAYWYQKFNEDGYVIFNNILSTDKINQYRNALTPYLQQEIMGRNNFEGLKTNRIYSILAKAPIIGELVTHPLSLAFAEAELGPSCLLSACVAINLQPGESAQPWHYDDNHIDIPLPHPAYGCSTFWAIDTTTEENGATEIIPGSHKWSECTLNGFVSGDDFTDTTLSDDPRDPFAHPDAIKAVLPAGSLLITKSTLFHRGGANRSAAPRLVITPQYCPGWARQLENIHAATPRYVAATFPKRLRELIGYSIHPPFMGFVDGAHPDRLLNLSTPE